MNGDECNCPVCSYDARPVTFSMDVETGVITPPVMIRAFDDEPRPITNPALAARVRQDAIARENPTPLSAVIALGSVSDAATATWADPDGWHLSAVFIQNPGENGDFNDDWLAELAEDNYRAQAQAFDEVAIEPFLAREAIADEFDPFAVAGRVLYGNDYEPEPTATFLPRYLYEAGLEEGFDMSGYVVQQDIPRSFDAILEELNANIAERHELLDELVAAIDREAV